MLGYWDCPYCSTKGVGGLERECPNCGRPRGEDTKFYMKRQKVYLDKETVANIGKSPDWFCPYCGSLNNSGINSCKSCGSPKDVSVDDYFSILKKQRRESARAESSVDLAANNNPISTSEKKGFLRKLGIILIESVLLFGIIFGLVALLNAEKTLVVTELSWERIIGIERYQTVDESDWYLPAGATLTRTSDEIRSYRQEFSHNETKTRTVSEEVLAGYETYITGYTDNGNGTFTENTSQRAVYRTEYRTETYQEPVYISVPVYGTKYYYEIDRWLFERNIVSRGVDQNPQWGTVFLGENERESGRSESCFVEATDNKGKTKRYSLNREDWMTLKVGAEIKVKVLLGNRLELLESSSANN